MATISTYSNNYTSSDNYGLYTSNINRDRDSRQNQKQFSEPMGHFKNQFNGSNPYYDNSFQYVSNTPRDSLRNLSTDRHNQKRISNSLEPDRNIPSNRNHSDEPRSAQYKGNQQALQSSNLRMDDRLSARGNNYEGSYSKPELKQQNGQLGLLWSNSFGQNSVPSHTQQGYKDRVKTSNELAYGNRASINNNVQPYGEYKSRGSIRKKKDLETPINQADSWYIQNYNVGILLGMGNVPEVRKSTRMPTFGSQPIEQHDRRPSSYDSYSRNHNSDGGLGNASASRLAGIGGKLMDIERPSHGTQRGRTSNRPEQLRIPQGPQDYGFKNSASNFHSPQYALNRTYAQPNVHTPQYNRPSLENQGYRGEAQNHNNEQRYSAKKYEKDREREQDNGKDIYGNNWLVERNKQEEDKKQKQKDELQRIYREQIEEKNRKKDEEKRRKLDEERREDERLRKENEEINKQFLAEQQPKKRKGGSNQNVQSTQQNAVMDDYARKKPQKQIQQFETSMENPISRKNSDKPNEYGNAQIMKIEGRIKSPSSSSSSSNNLADQMRSNNRFELYREPGVNVHRAVMERYNFNLDDELQKMRRNLKQQSNMIKNDLMSYKTQAINAQELRENAQKDLMRLREELRNQQLQEERRPYEEFDLASTDKQFTKTPGLRGRKQSEKSGLRIPKKNYSKIQGFEDEEEDLGASQVFNFEVETDYVPIGGLLDGHLQTFKKPHGIAGLMTKHGLNDDRTSSLVNDDAMHKFGQIFSDNRNHSSENSLRSEAKAQNNSRTMNKVSSSHNSAKNNMIDHNEHSYNYFKESTQIRQGEKTSKASYNNKGHNEGEDKIQRLEGLLDTYQSKDEHSLQSQHSQLSHHQNQTKKPIGLPARYEEKILKHDSVNHIHEDIDGEAEDSYQDKNKHSRNSKYSQLSHRQNQTKRLTELPSRLEEKMQKKHSVNHIHEDIDGEVEYPEPEREEEICEDYEFEEEGVHTVYSK